LQLHELSRVEPDEKLLVRLDAEADELSGTQAPAGGAAGPAVAARGGEDRRGRAVVISGGLRESAL
jgi:hypothetical protein